MLESQHNCSHVFLAAQNYMVLAFQNMAHYYDSRFNHVIMHSNVHDCFIILVFMLWSPSFTPSPNSGRSYRSPSFAESMDERKTCMFCRSRVNKSKTYTGISLMVLNKDSYSASYQRYKNTNAINRSLWGTSQEMFIIQYYRGLLESHHQRK